MVVGKSRAALSVSNMPRSVGSTALAPVQNPSHGDDRLFRVSGRDSDMEWSVGSEASAVQEIQI
jgi:hypothetical protein